MGSVLLMRQPGKPCVSEGGVEQTRCSFAWSPKKSVR